MFGSKFYLYRYNIAFKYHVILGPDAQLQRTHVATLNKLVVNPNTVVRDKISVGGRMSDHLHYYAASHETTTIGLNIDTCIDASQ